MDSVRVGLQIRALRRQRRWTQELGARVVVRILWRGEDLDRLLDRDHARIVEKTLDLLAREGWLATPEASFNVAGERGSIDILAWHAPARSLLVVEVKSVVPDIQATIGGLDRKARLGPAIARERGMVSQMRGAAARPPRRSDRSPQDCRIRVHIRSCLAG